MDSSTQIIAPALAVTCSFDFVATLSCVLAAYQGPMLAAAFPQTGDTRLDIAAGLGDLLVLSLLRGSVCMAPLLGAAAPTVAWLAAAGAAITAISGWLAAKAVLLWQLAGPGDATLEVAGTGVRLHINLVLAAEALGVVMGALLMLLVVRLPACNDPLVELQARTAAALRQRRLAVQQWVLEQELPAGAAGAAAGGEITAPLLEGEDDVEAASFVSARSQQQQLSASSSFATAASLDTNGGGGDASAMPPAGAAS